MCKFLICIIISASISWSCDLNHDWKVVKLNSYRDLSAAALHRMLENTMIKYRGKVLVIDVKDLYGLKGKINQTGESIGDTYRTTQEIIDFEARLMSGVFTSKKVSFYSSNDKNYDKTLLYDPKVLEKLAIDTNAEYFLRVKLRSYSRIEREYEDRYTHNKNVYQKTVDHTAEISFALLSTEGRYIDFVDDKSSFQERIVYQQLPDKEPILILRAGFDKNQKKWISKANYLGLDTIVPMAKDVAQSIVGFQ